ncbi:N-terminal cleavage protein [Opitutaceae bacterium TAV5]|nr:N-terminal cleavage protein [Opitutaceae bacterium TAV5]
MNPYQPRPRTMHDRSPARSAFTLIELLTVIAIIGILAAIIIPAVSAVRSKARAITCVSNMRQIGAAISGYAADNGDKLPGPIYRPQGTTISSDASGNIREENLAGFLAPYMGESAPPSGYSNARETKVFRCPVWDRLKESSSSLSAPFQANVLYFGTPQSASIPASPPLQLGRIQSPSMTAALFETDWKDGTGETTGQHPRYAQTPVHETYRNYLFFDGSVRSIKLADQDHQQQLIKDNRP